MSPPTRPIGAALTELAASRGFALITPPLALCTDNAAMVAWAGIERLSAGLGDPLDFAARPRWPLDAASAEDRRRSKRGKGMTIETVGVIGGGAWGTALALVAARAGRTTTLYDHDEAIVTAINAVRRSPPLLAGEQLPIIGVDRDRDDAVAADIVIAAVPAQALRAADADLAAHIRDGEADRRRRQGHRTRHRQTPVRGAAEVLPTAAIAVLSGPSFAADVAKNLPTAVTIAAADEALALGLCRALGGPAFRPYAETDIIGVELGGALKNVLAIAAGIVAGRGLGASAGAALVARGFAEMRRFAEAFGARSETLMGLSGLGDVILTCSSPQSRNYSVGLALGDGRPIPDLLAEGVPTANIARRIADERGISMPVTAAVAAVLAGKLSVDDAVDGTDEPAAPRRGRLTLDAPKARR